MDIFASFSNIQIYALLFGVTFVVVAILMFWNDRSNKNTSSPFSTPSLPQGKKKLSEKDL